MTARETDSAQQIERLQVALMAEREANLSMRYALDHCGLWRTKH
jgi:hypothetical protein